MQKKSFPYPQNPQNQQQSFSSNSTATITNSQNLTPTASTNNVVAGQYLNCPGGQVHFYKNTMQVQNQMQAQMPWLNIYTNQEQMKSGGQNQNPQNFRPRHQAATHHNHHSHVSHAFPNGNAPTPNFTEQPIIHLPPPPPKPESESESGDDPYVFKPENINLAVKTEATKMSKIKKFFLGSKNKLAKESDVFDWKQAGRADVPAVSINAPVGPTQMQVAHPVQGPQIQVNQVNQVNQNSALSQAQQISENLNTTYLSSKYGTDEKGQLDWKYLWFFSDDSRSSTDNTTHSRVNESDAETQIHVKNINGHDRQPPSVSNSNSNSSQSTGVVLADQRTKVKLPNEKIEFNFNQNFCEDTVPKKNFRRQTSTQVGELEDLDKTPVAKPRQVYKSLNYWFGWVRKNFFEKKYFFLKIDFF